jgi:FixJ family two-component response regulator
VLVLIVDDNAALRAALVRSMRHAGLSAEAFDSAEALLAHGVPERDACLVLDLKLPGLDGAALSHRLAESGRDLPTVFITAQAPEDVQRPPGGGAAEVLHKPFDKKHLLDAIGRACG